MPTGRGHEASHAEIIKRARDVQYACAEELARAQWYQDLFHQHESKAHFDNCDFENGTAYVESLLAEAKQLASKGETHRALFCLGQALHGLQDFYSHSNYLEMMESEHAKLKDVPILRIWTAQGKSRLFELVAKGLHSGTVTWGNPKKCPDGTPTHGALAKDTPTSPNGKQVVVKWENRTRHKVAVNLAERATQAFLLDAFRDIPQLKAACGTRISYLLLMDRRTP
jgi:hypothetical protein